MSKESNNATDPRKKGQADLYSYIKRIGIELDENYRFDNLPYPQTEDGTGHLSEKCFIGRKDDVAKFTTMLRDNKGVYLVTGFRGMGKTSFVNRVLDLLLRGDNQVTELQITPSGETQTTEPLTANREPQASGTKDNEKNPSQKTTACKQQKEIIRITLAQKQPSDTEILKLIVSLVKGKYQEFLETKTRELSHECQEKKYYKIFLSLAISFLALTFLLLYEDTFFKRIFYFKDFGFNILPDTTLVPQCLALLCLFAMAWYCVAWLRKKSLAGKSTETYKKNFDLINNLSKRCFAAVTIDGSEDHELILEKIGAKIKRKTNRSVETYPLASAKEIEVVLAEFFKRVENDQKYIFVFDELDKVEPSGLDPRPGSLSENTTPERAYLRQVRERKQAVLSIIAGLKNFLTTSNASYIFIAGREMFDASMADISDRQSAISSIFSYVFYVESFLKETHKKTSSLSAAIEEYLYRCITGKPLYPENTPRENFYKKIWKELGGDKQEDANSEEVVDKKALKKTIIFLQHFVVFLTYRSNGSPKKLVRIVEEFISVREYNADEIAQFILWKNPANKNTSGKKLILYFDYKNQQRIGYINYLYRPFLIRHGRGIKKFNDTLVVATSYMFDNLLKFHPFAFSIANLELLPEILSTSKTPELRDHIKKIIEFLTNSHIKETEIGLFDYKFYSKTINEIFYLSKIFEEESAAFNFTLDEAYLIKIHIKDKIAELRSVYEDSITNANNSAHLVFSIAYMNGLLGDLHFFDQEYDDAIVAYSNVIKPIRNMDMDAINLRDFITLIRFKLKLGLCFEKIKSYEESLAFYTDASQDARRFIMSRMRNENRMQWIAETDQSATNTTAANTTKTTVTLSEEKKKRDSDVFISSSMSDLLQIVNQGFIAKMVLQEKMGIEGITGAKSAITMGGFLTLATASGEFCGLNSPIVTNFFMQVGNLLYFKNSVKGFEWKHPVTGAYHKNIETYVPEPYRSEIMKHIGYFGNKSKSEHRKPLLALSMYCIGLEQLLSDRIKTVGNEEKTFSIYIDQKINLANIIDKLEPGKFKDNYKLLGKIHLKNMAILLSNIGDCILGSIEKKKEPGNNTASFTYKIHEIFNIKKLGTAEDTNHSYGNDHRQQDIARLRSVMVDYNEARPGQKQVLNSPVRYKEDFCIQRAIEFYSLSAYYFGKCGRSLSYGFQLRKILYVLRLVLDMDQNTDDARSLITFLEKNIVNKILEIASRNAEFSDTHLIKKNKEIWGSEDEFARASIANLPEVREAIILFAHLSIRILPEVRSFEDLIHPYLTLTTQYLRLIELNFAARQAEVRVKKSLRDAKSDTESKNARIQFLAVYLHSLISTINILEIYDHDYMVGYSFIAYTHFRIALILDINNQNKDDSHFIAQFKKEDIDEVVDLLTEFSNDAKTYSMYDEKYNYRMARMNYDNAIKLHSAGSEYKKAMDDIIYLEDDLNDNSYHFGAAMDRYLMLNNVFLNNRELCSKRIKESKWNTVHAILNYKEDE
jgi:hypothetical protein